MAHTKKHIVKEGWTDDIDITIFSSGGSLHTLVARDSSNGEILIKKSFQGSEAYKKADMLFKQMVGSK